MAQRIEALARRVQADPDFLAFTLADYAHSEGLSDAALAERLGCNVRQLSKLRLCRRPRSEPGLFQADLTRIATMFALDRDILLEAVRRGDVLVALRESAADSGFLMAARDRNGTDSVAPDEDEDAP